MIILIEQKTMLVIFALSFFDGFVNLFSQRYLLNLCQQCGYKIMDTFTITYKKMSFMYTPFCDIFILFVFCLLSLVLKNIAVYSFVAVCFLYRIISGYSKKIETKIDLKYTKRMIRLILTNTILNIILSCIILSLAYLCLCDSEYVFANLLVCSFVFKKIINPLLICISLVINCPFERCVYNYYKQRCKRKLKELDVFVIGITGSYGKTTIKQMLMTILSQKYSVMITPNSYNTPMGIAKTVNSIDKHYDYFIVEMGAKKIGDIKEICDMVSPKIAIMSGIVEQHLQTFLSLQNILKTKYEIVDCLKGNLAIFNIDSDNTYKLYQKCKSEKENILTIGVGGSGDVTYKNVEATSNGLKFTVKIFDKEFTLTSNVIGYGNILNILMCLAVAYKLNLSINQMVCGVSKIKQVKHRLEVIKKDNITIIDDSYNANPVGVENLLVSSRLFAGRKIIITPGMVELGSLSQQLNFEFGKLIAKYCDIAVIVEGGESQSIIEGIMFYESDCKIVSVKDIKEGVSEYKKISQTNDVVMFSNDLPDNF